jgi:hypothetical protein
MIADEKGFWLATNWELFFLEPESKRIEMNPAPFPPLSGLVSDGDYLWIACAPDTGGPQSGNRLASLPGQGSASQILLFRKSDRRWLAVFTLPGQAGRLARVKNLLYLSAQTSTQFFGPQGGRDSLFELDTQAILSNLAAKTVAK